jgi:hypothetical protein
MTKRGKRNKGGRPRTAGERYANGDLTKAEKRRRAREREQENLAVVIEQRQKHLGISEDLAKDALSPIVAWRWSKRVVDGATLIQEHHYKAAEALQRLYFDNLKAIRCPDLPRTPAGDKPKGGKPLDLDGTDPEYVDWCKRKRAQWSAVRGALLRSGKLHWFAAKTIAIENVETLSLAGDFREAMNVVSAMLSGAERRAA